MIYDKEVNDLHIKIYDDEKINDLAKLLIENYENSIKINKIMYSISRDAYVIGDKYYSYNDSFVQTKINFNLFRSSEFKEIFSSEDKNKKILFLKNILIKKINDSYNSYLNLLFEHPDNTEILIRDLPEDCIMDTLYAANLYSIEYLTDSDKEKLYKVLYKKQSDISKLYLGYDNLISILGNDIFEQFSLFKKVIEISPGIILSTLVYDLFTIDFDHSFRYDLSIDFNSDYGIKLIKILEELYEILNNDFSNIYNIRKTNSINRALSINSEKLYYFIDFSDDDSPFFTDSECKYFLTASDFNEFNRNLVKSIINYNDVYFNVFNKMNNSVIDSKFKKNIIKVLLYLKDNHTLFGINVNKFLKIIESIDSKNVNLQKLGFEKPYFKNRNLKLINLKK